MSEGIRPWIVALGIAAASPGRTADADARGRCVLVARVAGDPALVEPVVTILAGRGVPVTGAGSCGAIRARLDAEDEQVRVTITDADGRVVERIADDVEAAATAIESWSRRDVSDPLLAARALPRREAAATAEPSRGRDLAIAAGAEAALSGDGALWAGARADGCARVGPLCVGAMVAYAIDTASSGDSARYETERSALDLLLTGAVIVERGRFTLAPGVAVGQSSVHIERDRTRDLDNLNQLQLRAALAASCRLAAAWSLRLELGAAYAPFADPLLQDPEDITAGDPPLAGAPRLQGRVGLGLTFGGP